MTREQWEVNHSYEIAFRNLNPIGWSNLTENEKIENLQAIENKNTLDNGRIPVEIRVEDMPDSQAGFISEVRAGYTSNELEARASPIQCLIRTKMGAEKTIMDQSRIADVDQECHFKRNQIFETYNYFALNESGLEG